jgi:hypothetical protein
MKTCCGVKYHSFRNSFRSSCDNRLHRLELLERQIFRVRDPNLREVFFKMTPDRRANGTMRCTLLMLLFVQPIVGPVQFDPDNGSEASPCCVSSDDTLLLLGSFSTTFCKIEYPVRSTVQWNKSVALKWDRQAKRMVRNLTALNCDPEACTVKLFPK